MKSRRISVERKQITQRRFDGSHEGGLTFRAQIAHAPNMTRVVAETDEIGKHGLICGRSVAIQSRACGPQRIDEMVGNDHVSETQTRHESLAQRADVYHARRLAGCLLIGVEPLKTWERPPGETELGIVVIFDDAGPRAPGPGEQSKTARRTHDRTEWVLMRRSHIRQSRSHTGNEIAPARNGARADWRNTSSPGQIAPARQLEIRSPEACVTGTRRQQQARHIVAPGLLTAALVTGCGAGDMETQVALPEPPASPRVVILEPADGAELDAGPVRIVMQAENIELAPAGEDRPNTGHLHLFINQPVTPAGDVIPAGVDGTVHLGQAQTEFELTATAAGEYTVIVALGDFAHRTIDPQAMDTVRFRVRDP